MKLKLIMPGQEDEVIQDGLTSFEDAIDASKEYLADYFSSELVDADYEIDEESFYVSEDWDGDDEAWCVHMVANSFGDLSDFYVSITKK